MVRLRDSWPFSLSSAPTVGNPCRPPGAPFSRSPYHSFGGEVEARTPPRYAASTPHAVTNFRAYLVTAVYDVNGKQIGTITRLVIEKVSGHVAYAVTSFGGFLGLGAEVHSIPWEH